MNNTTWLDKLLDKILSKQSEIVPNIPTELKVEGKGRRGKFIISGDPSTIRYFIWNGISLVEDKSQHGDESNIRNIVEMHVDTLLDLMSGEYGMREAVAAGLIVITGDRSLYDREEWFNIFDKFIKSQLRPEFLLMSK